MDEVQRKHLQRCVELAAEALELGNEPFGSVLVGVDGTILAEDHNRQGAGDPTAHPEIALARWAVQHLGADERAAATVYTSGEHCAMCSAAHAWAGLGPIVFASSAQQLTAWFTEAGLGSAPVLPLSINEVAPQVRVTGPVAEFAEQVYALHRHRFRTMAGAVQG
jgi:tRNA(Arg) A34 adenosine deaminase TadA